MCDFTEVVVSLETIPGISKTLHFETRVQKTLMSEKTTAAVVYINSRNTKKVLWFHLKTEPRTHGLNHSLNLGVQLHI